jgi:hypothetical protein
MSAASVFYGSGGTETRAVIPEGRVSAKAAPFVLLRITFADQH